MARPSPNRIACLDATKTFLASHWCCTPGRTPLEPAGAPPPASRTSTVPAPPWNRLLRPPPGEPRPPLGAALAPLTLPQLSPHLRGRTSPEIAPPFLLCLLISARDLELKETKLPGSNLQNVHELQNSELVKYITIRIQIVKMQTQLIWNPCNKIYKFCNNQICRKLTNIYLWKRIRKAINACSVSSTQQMTLIFGYVVPNGMLGSQ